MSYAFIAALSKYSNLSCASDVARRGLTHEDLQLLQAIREELRGKYDQKPQARGLCRSRC